MNRRQTVIRVALLCVACLGSFAVAEGVLAVYTPFELVTRGDRIVLPAHRTWTINNDQTRREFRSSPWIAGKLDSVIVHNKNSLGLRGPEPPSAFDKQLTIVTVGGSTTECFYLSEGKTWPDRLATLLSSTFSGLWLNNAGLDGHSTFGHTVLMEDHIAQLKPKVVTFLIGINDLHADQPLETDRRQQKAGLDFRSPKTLLISAANYSQLFAVALNLYRHSRAKLLGLEYQLDFNLTALESRTVSVKDARDIQTRYERGLASYRQRVERLIAISRKNAIEPVLMTQPTLYGEGVDDVTKVNLETLAVMDGNGKLAWDILEEYNDVTRDVGVREGVLVIDLAKKLPKSSRYFYDFYHYTNEGAVEIAEIVDESLCPFLAEKFPQYVRGSCAGRAAESHAESRHDAKL